jgi:hypothetical protein
MTFLSTNLSAKNNFSNAITLAGSVNNKTRHERHKPIKQDVQCCFSIKPINQSINLSRCTAQFSFSLQFSINQSIHQNRFSPYNVLRKDLSTCFNAM